ncbi:hypothetical protein V2W45_1430445 [Cenococcum geophilum]
MIVKLQWPSSMAFLRAFLDYTLRRRQAKPNSRSSKALAVGSRRATSSSKSLTSEPLLVYLKKRFVDIILNRPLRALPDLGDADSRPNESSNLCKPSSNLSCSKCMDQKSKAPTYFRDVGNIGNEMHPTRSEGYCTLCKELWGKQATRNHALDGPIKRLSADSKEDPTVQNITPILSANSNCHPCTLTAHNLRKEICVGADLASSSSASKLDTTDLGNPHNPYVNTQGEDNGCPHLAHRHLPNRIACEVRQEYYLSRQIMADIEELEREAESLERIIAELQPEWAIFKLRKSVQLYICRSFGKALAKIERTRVNLLERIILTLFPPKRLCIICTDAKQIGKFPQGKITACCGHEPQVCSEDVQIWITSELESKGWENIRCPECRELLERSDIRKLASKKTLARYETLVTRAILSANPNFRWCLNPECDSGQIHENNRDGPVFRCAECKTKICVFHERAWHKGETCKQFDYRVAAEKQRVEEAASIAVIEKITKKCPGKPGQPCGWNIEKVAGCDHMTCSRCGGEFCYICLAFYEPIRKQGNSMHRSTCKYHSNNIPGR